MRLSGLIRPSRTFSLKGPMKSLQASSERLEGGGWLGSKKIFFRFQNDFGKGMVAFLGRASVNLFGDPALCGE